MTAPKELAAQSRNPGIGDRLKLAGQRVAGSQAGPTNRQLLRETTYPLSPITRRFLRSPVITQAKRGRVVLMLPGFLASPITMRYLSRQVERAGHTAKRWGMGVNLGPSDERISRLEARLAEVSERYDGKVSLVGWSLGGLYARELARRHPDQVEKVITMGSPFSGDPRANNAWRLYQFVTGHKVDEVPLDVDVRSKPPVETVALWSPRDGIVSARSACGRPGERDRAVALRCTHMGFSYDPEAVEAVLRELDRS